MEPALIAVIGAVIGVLLTNGIRLVLDARARAEKVRDIQTALRAEIRSHRHAFELLGEESEWRLVVDEVAAGGFVPLTPNKASPFVFDAIVGEIHILPGAVVDPVVLYYGQYATVRAFIDELRGEHVRQLDAGRRASMIEDYFIVSRYALQLATEAVDAIDISLDRREVQ
ncbi:MAG: hypothetical protein P4M09_07240 [Devosia sp.]|nr:hypothetical protein [Devosia sp.]